MLVEHTEVNDKTLGVIGYGSIGQEVIRIAKVLDMKILAHTENTARACGGSTLCFPARAFKGK